MRNRFAVGGVLLLVLAAGFFAWRAYRGGDAPEEGSSGAGAGASGGSAASGRSDYVALLVGINDYPEGEWSPGKLEGCVNDVRRMQDVLARFGFAPEDVRVLLDEEATHANIVRAFYESLVERSGPNTEALFYFSGHGSRVPDRSGDLRAEPDGKDSSFLAYDSRIDGRRGQYDLVDDELSWMVADLQAKTSRVTIITDSCHSGSGVRSGGGERFRFAPEGNLAVDHELIRDLFPGVEMKDDHERREFGIDYLHIAACGEEERAREYVIRDADGERTTYGALTHFLADEMERAERGATFRDLIDRTRNRLFQAVPSQEVWFEGQANRQLFGGDFRDPPGGHAAQLLPGRRIYVEAGRLHGLYQNATLALEGSKGELVGHATVGKVRATSSLAEWSSEDEVPPRDALLRARLVSRPYEERPLRVHAEDALKGRLSWAEALVTWVPEADADYRIVAPEADEPRLETIEGIVIGRGADLFLRDPFTELVQHELIFRALFDLPASSGSLTMSARFDTPSFEDVRRWEVPASKVRVIDGTDDRPPVASAVGGPHYDDPLMAMLNVTNPTNETVYLTVFSVAEDHGKMPIWPRDGTHPVLPAGETEQIPVGVVLLEGWWEVTGRPMRDRYVIFATREKLDLSGFRRRSESEKRGGSDGESEEDLAEQKDFLHGVFADVEGDGWGVTVVDLLVMPGEKLR